MASGQKLAEFDAQSNLAPAWLWVAFTSGGTTTPAKGDVIHGDTSAASARIEFILLASGTWGGGDAAGYFFLSNWNGSAWTSGENFSIGGDTVSNHGTLTSVPVACHATLDARNDKPVLDFDDTVNEVVLFRGKLADYDGGGLTFTVSVAATSATTGDFSYGAMLMSITPDADDLDVKVFAEPQYNAAIDVASAAGETVDFAITFTSGAQMDSLADGENYYLLLFRDARDGTNDDAAGDAEFVSAVLTET